MIKIVGAGLAGSEAACFLASRKIQVELIDMKPEKFTPAHSDKNFAELVCSNSLKSDDALGNACGLLKAEMRRLGSVTMQAAEIAKVPAGGALAVDREKFAAFITKKIKDDPYIKVTCEETEELPEEGIVATGPLTGGKLYDAIEQRFGGSLHFFDASAPIVSRESVDLDKTFSADRYGKGTGDYLNCPMTKEEYETFTAELLTAKRAKLHEFEKREIFEGCMPLEVMAQRGIDTLRFGTFKPVGLFGRDGKRPYAVLQLRKENAEGTSLGLVGCQTNLQFSEQKRVFSLIPALKNAEFERYGVMHRNTYLHSPDVLNADFSVRSQPKLYFAGQITGVEGYVESAMSGLLAGIHCYRRLCGKPTLLPSTETMCGALSDYIANTRGAFEPMNANYGVLKTDISCKDKSERRKKIAERALEEIEKLKESI